MRLIAANAIEPSICFDEPPLDFGVPYSEEEGAYRIVGKDNVFECMMQLLEWQAASEELGIDQASIVFYLILHAIYPVLSEDEQLVMEVRLREVIYPSFELARQIYEELLALVEGEVITKFDFEQFSLAEKNLDDCIACCFAISNINSQFIEKIVKQNADTSELGRVARAVADADPSFSIAPEVYPALEVDTAAFKNIKPSQVREMQRVKTYAQVKQKYELLLGLARIVEYQIPERLTFYIDEEKSLARIEEIINENSVLWNAIVDHQQLKLAILLSEGKTNAQADRVLEIMLHIEHEEDAATCPELLDDYPGLVTLTTPTIAAMKPLFIPDLPRPERGAEPTKLLQYCCYKKKYDSFCKLVFSCEFTTMQFVEIQSFLRTFPDARYLEAFDQSQRKRAAAKPVNFSASVQHGISLISTPSQLVSFVGTLKAIRLKMIRVDGNTAKADQQFALWLTAAAERCFELVFDQQVITGADDFFIKIVACWLMINAIQGNASAFAFDLIAAMLLAKFEEGTDLEVEKMNVVNQVGGCWAELFSDMKDAPMDEVIHSQLFSQDALNY